MNDFFPPPPFASLGDLLAGILDFNAWKATLTSLEEATQHFIKTHQSYFSLLPEPGNVPTSFVFNSDICRKIKKGENPITDNAEHVCKTLYESTKYLHCIDEKEDLSKASFLRHCPKIGIHLLEEISEDNIKTLKKICKTNHIKYLSFIMTEHWSKHALFPSLLEKFLGDDIRKLVLQILPKSTFTPEITKGFVVFCKKNKNLKHMILRGANSAQYHTVLQKMVCPKLENLSFEMAKWSPESTDILISFILNCKQIKHLSISACSNWNEKDIAALAEMKVLLMQRTPAPTITFGGLPGVNSIQYNTM